MARTYLDSKQRSTSSKPKSNKRISSYDLEGRLWVEKDGEMFFGRGRIALLERIREYGSLNAAARSMGMGYRHALAVIDHMNHLSPKPLVEKSIGGKGGGGSQLTTAGEATVAYYRKMVSEFEQWIATRKPFDRVLRDEIE